MFTGKDAEDLRDELGLTPERADELVDIVNNIMDQETPESEYGRTSHVLLNIAGRKDLSDVERVACTFLFCCRILQDKIGGTRTSRSSRQTRSSSDKIEEPRIIEMPPGMLSGMHRGMPRLKGEEFIDIEEGIAGMIVAPEGIDKSELLKVMMTSIITMLRGLPKKDAQEFCKQASVSFARMALGGDIKL